MKESVFTGHGIEVLRDGARHFIRYDAGGIAVQQSEIEVSAEEAAKAMTSEQGAYEMILLASNRNAPNSN